MRLDRTGMKASRPSASQRARNDVANKSLLPSILICRSRVTDPPQIPNGSGPASQTQPVLPMGAGLPRSSSRLTVGHASGLDANPCPLPAAGMRPRAMKGSAALPPEASHAWSVTLRKAKTVSRSIASSTQTAAVRWLSPRSCAASSRRRVRKHQPGPDLCHQRAQVRRCFDVGAGSRNIFRTMHQGQEGFNDCERFAGSGNPEDNLAWLKG